MALADQVALASDGAFQARVLYALLNYVTGTVLAETTSDVQTLSIGGGVPTSGNFFLSGGPLTQQINVSWNETAAGLQAKVSDVLDVGAACVCLGGPLPGAGIAVTWTGSLADSPQNVMAVGASTLSAGTAGVAHTTAGVGALRHADRKALAARIIAAPNTYAGPVCQLVTTDATVMADYTGGGKAQTAVTDAHLAAAVAAVYNAVLGG